MSPINEFKDQLFLSAGATEDRVFEFSCGHVVQDENILPLVLKSGPASVTLDFTYNNRKNSTLVRNDFKNFIKKSYFSSFFSWMNSEGF